MAWDGDLPRSYQQIGGGGGGGNGGGGNGGGGGGPGGNISLSDRGSVIGSGFLRSSDGGGSSSSASASTSFGRGIGRPAPHPMVQQQHLTGLAEGDVPIGGISTDGYADVGILDRLKRNPFVMVGAAALLFLLVAHPGGGRDGYAGGGGNNNSTDPVLLNSKVGGIGSGGLSSSSSSSSTGAGAGSGAGAFGFYDKGGSEGSGVTGGGIKGGDGGDAHIEEPHEDAADDDEADDDDHVTVGGADISSSSSSSPLPSGPEIVWLLAYPMSGASYIERLASSFDPARPLSSVGANHVSAGVEHRPIFEDSPEGPFYVSFDDRSEESKTDKADPDAGRYVLTLTDCSGHCYSPCPPAEFVETIPSFDAACRSTSWHDGSSKKRSTGSYTPDHVTKAVRMVRDPLSNVVSRFRVHRRRVKDDNGTLKYPEGKEGFNKWCKDNDAATAEDEDASRFFPSEVLELMKDVPCHDEFFKYVQWHNLAGLERQYRGLGPKLHDVYYEEFDGELEGANPGEAVQSLREFLGAASAPAAAAGKKSGGATSSHPLFRGANMYLNYYTERQRTAIWAFAEAMAFPETWELLRRYHSSSSNIE